MAGKPSAHGPAEHFIGELGTVRTAEDAAVVFGYFGTRLRANPLASDLAFIEFLDKAENLDKVNEVEAVRLVLDYLREQIHPDDWDEFWRLAKANHQTSTDLMLVSHQIQGAIAGFPTGQPSVSRAGRRATARKSGARSPSRATQTRASRSRAGVVDGEVVSRQDVVMGRAMELLDGRPDLKVAVWEAQQARAGSRG